MTKGTAAYRRWVEERRLTAELERENRILRRALEDQASHAAYLFRYLKQYTAEGSTMHTIFETNASNIERAGRETLQKFIKE